MRSPVPDEIVVPRTLVLLCRAFNAPARIVLEVCAYFDRRIERMGARWEIAGVVVTEIEIESQKIRLRARPITHQLEPFSRSPEGVGGKNVHVHDVESVFLPAEEKNGEIVHPKGRKVITKEIRIKWPTAVNTIRTHYDKAIGHEATIGARRIRGEDETLFDLASDGNPKRFICGRQKGTVVVL